MLGARPVWGGGGGGGGGWGCLGRGGGRGGGVEGEDVRSRVSCRK